MRKLKTLSIFGTRPEAIKMAPVILQLEGHRDIESSVCVTAQHREMLDQALGIFDIKIDHDLDLMKENQTLDELSANMLTKITPLLKKIKPDLVLVQGDTTTAFISALAAYYQKIPVGHIEAGLRTGNIYSPWPEEVNRLMLAQLARLHFAPTRKAENRLLMEGIPENSITITGNTVIDSLFLIKKKIETDANILGSLASKFPQIQDRQYILMTGHRRESFGKGFEDVCQAVSTIALHYPNILILYPVHLNPNVREPVFRILGHHNNIELIEPVDYLSFIYLMKNCKLILTDSGGIQEEAIVFNKPVLVTRQVTEREEVIEIGAAKLVGTELSTIVTNIVELLENSDSYNAMINKQNPYGDGKASERIIEKILEYHKNQIHL